MKTRIIAILAVLASLSSLVACNRGDDAPAPAADPETGAAPGSAGEAGSAALDEPEVDPYAVLVDEVATHLEDWTPDPAKAGEMAKRLEARLTDAKANAEARKTSRKTKRPPIDLFYEDLLDEVYTAREYVPLLTRNGRLTRVGRALWQAIEKSPDHALDPKDYWGVELAPLTTRDAELAAQLDALAFVLVDAERETLRAYLEKTDYDVEGKGLDGVLALITSTDAANPVPRLAAQRDSFDQLRGELRAQAVELEVRLFDGFLRYARDMKLGNLNFASQVEEAKYGHPFKLGSEDEIILARVRAAATAIGDMTEPEEAEAFIADLVPKHEQYAKLQAAWTKYKEIVANGGWPKVGEGRLEQGMKGKRVHLLKERLQAEGYYTGALDDVFDEPLVAAVSAYQETHQMEVTGGSSKTFWRSLDFDAKTRADEIEVNIRRWHKSFWYPSDYYVYINVPDFHGELWKDGERLRRWRIVTGNTTRKCDPETKQWYYANATPLQHAKMEFLVFNPYWNVPPRIEEEEYASLILENPKWPEENGFEYHTDNNFTVLRQLPGEDNALGKVKFIFPNMYSTFMHDTAQKPLFRYPVRAFSHGCMRVHEPMELAELILTLDGQWGDERVLKGRNTLDETQINLKHQPDVFIDYYTVRVDEQGRVNFLADIYKYVRNEVSPPSAAALRCKPEPEKAPQIAIARAKAMGKPLPEGAVMPTSGADGFPMPTVGATPDSPAPTTPAAKPGTAGSSEPETALPMPSPAEKLSGPRPNAQTPGPRGAGGRTSAEATTGLAGRKEKGGAAEPIATTP